MTNPIPAPRRPQDSGLTCASCAHRICRTTRAQGLPLLGGQRSEFAAEHQRANRLQALHPRLIVWFGESTQSFWVASRTGLYEAKDWDDLLAHLWAHSRLRRPRVWQPKVGA